jgi:hypothetical protein
MTGPDAEVPPPPGGEIPQENDNPELQDLIDKLNKNPNIIKWVKNYVEGITDIQTPSPESPEGLGNPPGAMGGPPEEQPPMPGMENGKMPFGESKRYSIDKILDEIFVKEIKTKYGRKDAGIFHK